MMKQVTVELVLVVDVPVDTPTIRILPKVKSATEVEYVVAPTQPDNGWDLEPRILCYQSRVSDGRVYLHDEPRRRDFVREALERAAREE